MFGDGFEQSAILCTPPTGRGRAGLERFRPRGLERGLCVQRHAATGTGQADRRAAERSAESRAPGAPRGPGAEPGPVAKATPESLRTLLKSEVDKWTPIIRKTGVYAD
jgi:hypothetical protein